MATLFGMFPFSPTADIKDRNLRKRLQKFCRISTLKWKAQQNVAERHGHAIRLWSMFTAVGVLFRLSPMPETDPELKRLLTQ